MTDEAERPELELIRRVHEATAAAARSCAAARVASTRAAAVSRTIEARRRRRWTERYEESFRRALEQLPWLQPERETD